MFFELVYKDPPELSTTLVERRSTTESDPSEEKTMLLNCNCPVRIMLDHIREKCNLGLFAEFDLCNETGVILGLFNLPPHEYAQDLLLFKKTYYIIVYNTEGTTVTVLPQINRDNKLYNQLKKAKKLNLEPTPTSQRLTSSSGVKTTGKIKKR